MTHEFLSPQWIAAVKALREEFPDAGSTVPIAVQMNLVVTDTPFGEPVHAHVDTTHGSLIIEEEHLDEPDLHITVDYATARALLVDGNPQAAMSAFMQGKVRIEGDMAKLMVLQNISPDGSAVEFAEAVRTMTS